MYLQKAARKLRQEHRYTDYTTDRTVLMEHVKRLAAVERVESVICRSMNDLEIPSTHGDTVKALPRWAFCAFPFQEFQPRNLRK